MDLDDVIPSPQYQICHSRVARAPLPAVWDALHRVTMSALPLGHALEGVRVLPARLSGKKLEPLAGRSFLDVTPIPVLFSERPHVVISAGLSQAWRLLGGPVPPHLDAAALRAWSEPGWIKAGMEFRLEPVRAGTLLSTETRVLATDPKTRRAFAAYWFVIRPGSSAIRREVLKVVARRAESSLKARWPVGPGAGKPFPARAGQRLQLRPADTNSPGSASLGPVVWPVPGLATAADGMNRAPGRL